MAIRSLSKLSKINTDGTTTPFVLETDYVTINGIRVAINGDANIPAFISYNNALYEARIADNTLQLKINGLWTTISYLPSTPLTHSSVIESFDDNWYSEVIQEYVLSESLTNEILQDTLSFQSIIASLSNYSGVTISLAIVTTSNYSNPLKSLLSSLSGFDIFAENDLGTMFNSGNNLLIKLKFDVSNRVIVECYVKQ